MFIANLTVIAALSLTNIAAITESLACGHNGDRFDISAELVSQCDINGIDQALCVKDKTGYAIIDQIPHGETPADLQSGDLLRISGFVSHLDFGSRKICSDKITRHGRNSPQLPVPITATEYLTGKFDSQLISLTGILRDAVKDEIDTRVMRLSMLSEGNTIFAFVTCAKDDTARYQRLINSKIKITGVCRNRCYSLRRMQGRIISVLHVSPLSPQNDPFDGTELDSALRLAPTDVLQLGRCHAIGRVLATWQGSRILIKTTQGAFSTVQTADTGTLPPCGAKIEVTGYASTDLYNINLSGAIWRQIGNTAPLNTPPISLTTRQLYRNASDNPRLDITFHGETISLQGIVRSIPPDGDSRTPFLLDDRGFIMPIDVSEHPEVLSQLSVGSQVRVAGICVTDTEEWHPYAGFPRTRGFTLVLRTPDDITIIAQPPFWTRQRLLAAVGTLFALLLGCVLWNRSLRRMVERKSRQLIKEEIAHAKADFRVEERTRLAANLHDSISQMLAGLGGYLRASIQILTTDPRHAAAMLITSEQMLQSCRKSLRMCLYDLRSSIMDDPDLNLAIRRTISPVTGNAKLAIRFNVARRHFQDSSLYSIFCILRELSGNACNHGKAGLISIAGTIDGDLLSFSVIDNGVGFNPTARPGFAQGHFGLDGIMNRVRKMNGTFAIESFPGKGTRCVVTIPTKHLKTTND